MCSSDLELWAWTLTPLTARTVAAWALALAAGLGYTAWQRDWARVRIATPTYVAIPVLQLVALARFSDTVDWSDPKLWAYVAYLGGVLLLGAYGLLQSWRTMPQGAGRRTRRAVIRPSQYL